MTLFKSILLVDDDEINNFINLRVLKKVQGAGNITTALNGKEALDHIRKCCYQAEHSCPKLILLDINMPVMNGFEFIENYQNLDFKTKANIRIVILSTSTNPTDVQKIMELGITDFISKPLTEEKVQRLLTDFNEPLIE